MAWKLSTVPPASARSTSMMLLRLLRRKQDVALRFADQGVVSAGNLAFGIFGARLLGPGEFGLFSLTWTLVVAGLALQWALVVAPFQRTFSDESKNNWPQFGTALAIHSLVIGMLLAAAAICISFIHTPPTFEHICSIGSACVLVVLQDYWRRSLLAQDKLKQALAGDLMRHLGAVGILFCAAAYFPPSPTMCLFSAALASALACMMAIKQAHFRHAAGVLRLSISLARRHFADARWLLPFVALQWMGSSAPLFFLAHTSGTSEAGGFRVLLYFMAPVITISEALETFLPLRAAAMANVGNQEDLRKYLIRLGSQVLTVCTLYALLLYVLNPWLIERAFGSSYKPYAESIPYISVAALSQISGYLFNALLRSIGRSRFILISEAVSASFLLMAYLIFSHPDAHFAASILAVTQLIKLGMLIKLSKNRESNPQ